MQHTCNFAFFAGVCSSIGTSCGISSAQCFLPIEGFMFWEFFSTVSKRTLVTSDDCSSVGASKFFIFAAFFCFFWWKKRMHSKQNVMRPSAMLNLRKMTTSYISTIYSGSWQLSSWCLLIGHGSLSELMLSQNTTAVWLFHPLESTK